MNAPIERGICPCCHRSLPVDACEDLARFEQLEGELEARVFLIEDQDYAGLVAHLEEIVARRGGDLYAVKDLGEAYVMNGEPRRAIDLLAPVHRRWPDFEDVQWVILDALFAQGLDESCFEWSRAVHVLRLGGEALDLCHGYLEQKRDPRDLEELYCELLSHGYLAFDERQLLAALEQDARFAVDEGPYWTAVALKAGAGERVDTGRSRP